MTARAEFDVGPLSWVKGEIDLAMQRGLESLRAFAGEPGEAAHIKLSQTHLHQAHGALQIVGLDGVTRLSEELEGLLADLEKGAVSAEPEVLALAERVYQAVLSYLDQLISGRPHQPLRLFPLYRELVKARPGARNTEAVDLYFPDLSFRPPKRGTAGVALKPGEVEPYLREQRVRYQRGLLKWLKKDASGALEMRSAVQAIESAQGPTSQRAFWWAALAFFDALAHEGVSVDADVKRLCNRVEQQIKRVMDGSPSVAERLMREVLYHVARAPHATDHVRLVQDVYHLADTLPPDEGVDIPLSAELPGVKSARDLLVQAKDAWNKFASGNAASLISFRDAASAMKECSHDLGNPEFAALTGETAALAAWLSSSKDKMSEAIALEVATALLLLENALTNFAELGAEFNQQSQLLCSRLKACVMGNLLRTAPEIPLLDEMSRRAQERLLMNQVVAEMQANLRAIEQALDAFFRDSTRGEELKALDTPVRQLLGALTMLGEARAQETLARVQRDIERLTDAAYRPDQADFERIAQTLSGLGFYIEALAHGKADFDAAMQPISVRKPDADLDGTQPVPTLEAHIADQKREAGSLYEEWKKTPENETLKAGLQKNLASIHQGAELIADETLGSSADDALKALEAAVNIEFTPVLAEAIEKIVPRTPLPGPSPDAAKFAEASAEQVDAELLSVYLEEADEVLAAIRENLALCHAQRGGKEALTTIRRSFHTLKGSGRMVGLTRLGEAAWAIEQTMNLWTQEERAATADLLSLASAAEGYFSENVISLRSGGGSSDERALVEMAERVRRGDSLAAPVQAPAAAQPEMPLPDIALAPDEDEDYVQLGERRVSATLFAIYSGEARAHFATIKQEHETLQLHGIVSDEFIRAVHTLAGSSGTVKFTAMHDLGLALEQVLHKLASSELSEEEQALVSEAVQTMDIMVQDALELRAPAEVPELVARLEQIGSPIQLAGSLDATTALPLPDPGVVPVQEAVGEVPSMSFELPELDDLIAASATAIPAQHQPETYNEEDAEPVIGDFELEDLSPERRQRRLDDDLDPQLLPIFLEEANELVPSIGSAVRDWRSQPDNPALGHALQRLLHTLKGSARMAGAMAIGELTHYMESRVENAQSMKILPATLFDELDSSYDRMGLLYERLQNPNAGRDEKGMTRAFTVLPQTGTPATAAALATQASAVPAQNPTAVVAPKRAAAAEKEVIAQRAMLRVRADMVDRLVNQAGEVSIARSRIEGEMRTLKGAMQELTDNVARLRAQLREIEIQAESQMQSRQEAVKEVSREFDPLEFDRFTRFQELTRLMAESVNDVSTVHQNLVNTVDETEKALLAQARLNRDLQQDLMQVRMVPFNSVSDRLYRIVRQTAKEVGKRANLEIRGTQVELDRSVLERITAPFEHLLRNAITHGIELPAQRAAAGKAEIGEIRLELSQESNEVQIVFADDGAGLNIPRIREKAVQLGLMGERVALSDAEIADFIFHAGFSTATEVSQLAGRGVGMDVVKNEVAALGGRIELKFEAGKGTRFTIFLPLTLAVTQAVIVRAGSRNWAIPAVMVEQVMQLKREQLDVIQKAQQAEWQSRRYPFHYLPHLLGAHDAAAEERRFSPVLFLRSGTNAIALRVDEMLGSNMEIVVKTIGPQLQRVAGVTGATVLGSGDILLILNPVQLALRGAVVVQPAVVAAVPKVQAPVAVQPTIMVVDDSLTVRKITGRLLERQGYLVVTARDGVEAMEKLQVTLPDVMLVDIEMPRMDGFDLTRNVRADARLKHVPIIMITSRTADKHQNYAREIGVNSFLGKPYQEDQLLGEIGGFLKDRRVAA